MSSHSSTGAPAKEVTSPTGTGTVALGLPNNPAFSDLRLHWQVLTLANGGPTLAGPISNDVVTQCSVAGTGLPAVLDQPSERLQLHRGQAFDRLLPIASGAVVPGDL